MVIHASSIHVCEFSRIFEAYVHPIKMKNMFGNSFWELVGLNSVPVVQFYMEIHFLWYVNFNDLRRARIKKGEKIGKLGYSSSNVLLSTREYHNDFIIKFYLQIKNFFVMVSSNKLLLFGKNVKFSDHTATKEKALF